jgi:two-component sensor histidine kinase
MGIFGALFDTTGFPARWYCGRWTPLHGSLHIAADLAVFGAYAAIPVALVYFVRRRRDVPFLPIFWLFAAFILACGFGHLVDATIFWQPRYRLLTAVKIVTGIVSWLTVLALVHVLPKALALHADLDQRVQERTAELSAMLREREVLLREVHHRVKNNLQVISSLINLQRSRLRAQGDIQAGALAHEPRDEALRQCQARVLTIARVHELLYRADDASRIPLAAYVESLVVGIDEIAALAPRVSIETDIDDVMLSVESGGPCGLILNELITNALKHGFVGERAGSIRVSARHARPAESRSRMEPPASTLTLEVSDDGVGLPASFDANQSASLGLTITRRLASQLKGQLEIERGERTTFRVTFPAPDLRLRSDPPGVLEMSAMPELRPA